MSIWTHLFGWQVLSSWGVVAWTEAFLLGAVFAMMGIGYGVPANQSSYWFVAAQVCFVAAAAIFLVKVAEVAIVMNHLFWERSIFTVVLFSVVGLATVEGARFIKKIAPLPPPTSSPPATPNPTVAKSPETKPQPSRPEQKPHLPATKLSQALEAPHYGNLALRCQRLANAISKFVEERSKKQPKNMPAQLTEYTDWYGNNDALFRFYYYKDIKELQADLAVVKVKEPQLDELIREYERKFYERNHGPSPETVRDNLVMYYTSIDDIEKIGRWFETLGDEVRHLNN